MSLPVGPTATAVRSRPGTHATLLRNPASEPPGDQDLPPSEVAAVRPRSVPFGGDTVLLIPEGQGTDAGRVATR